MKKLPKDDRRFVLKMKELNRTSGMTYSRLAERMRAKGFQITNLQLFAIADRRVTADRKTQDAIADILGCLRKDIF